MVDAEKVKTGLRICSSTKRLTLGCNECPYLNEVLCVGSLASDAAELIALLEERIAIMQESMETLEKRCNTLNALEQRCKALETLEKQEQPKKVYDPRLCNNSPKAYKGFCPWCNSVITLIHGKFCDKCGKAVKWK